MIGWAVRRPAVVWAACVALLLAGAVAFTRLPLGTRTTVELPRLRVQAAWPGASAELVETYLTSPIEGAIQVVRGVRKTSSESTEGQSRITVELDRHADVQMTRLAILERLETLRSEWPAGSVAPRVENYVPEEIDERPLLEVSVSGPYTAGALLRIVEEDLIPRLAAVPGVAGIAPMGGAEIGIAVAYDPARLRQLGLSPALLAAALRDSRLVQSLGDERAGATERRVTIRDEPRALADLEALPVRGPGGRVHRLGDLATVREEEDSRGRFYRIDGRPAVSMSIARLADADAIRTADRVRRLLDQTQPLLPPGTRFTVAWDESTELAKQLADLTRRGAIAFVAVALVLGLTLRSARGAGLVLGSAAVAVAGTALSLYLLRIPANLLTLAGLGMGIGILVQNGLVVVERLRSAPDTPAARAEEGRRIFPAVLGATLTTAVVLLPFLYLQGDARAAFVPFAAAFTLALGWSVASAVLMVPALGAGHGDPARGAWPGLARGYRRFTVALVRWRYVALGLTLASLGVLAWGFVAKVPRFSWGGWLGQRTTLQAFMSFPRGSDPESLDRGMREFEALAVGREGVEQVVTRGFGEGASMIVIFEKEAGLTAIPVIMEEELTQRAVLVGGASVSVRGQGPGFSSGFGAGGSVSFRIKVLGYSYAGVERMALDLKSRLENISRVRDVDANAGSFWRREKSSAVTLEPDRGALARHAVTAADFAQAVAREVRGPVGAQRIELGGEEVPVTLKTAGTRERSLGELRDALVANPSGAPVRVADLARVEEREALGAISREDQQYVRIVSYDFRGPSKLAQRTHDAFMASIAVPPGYAVEDVEYTFRTDESEQGLWLVFGVGVTLVILAVAMVFDSIWAAGLVFLSLPVALGGVVAAFWLTGATFSREAAVGVILVVGLAVNQAILLVDAALRRRGHGGRLGGAAVVAACRERAGMIVFVTLAALASLLPLAVGADSDSLFGAIALATLGGTAAGTVGALVVLPALLPALRRARLGRSFDHS